MTASPRIRWSSLCCLLCCQLLEGCRHRPVAMALPAAPPPAMISVPPPTHRSEPFAPMPLETVPSLDLELARKAFPRFRPLRATKAQLAALNPPPPPVELGQLTTGGESGNGSLRRQTEILLRGQQRRVVALPSDVIARNSQQVQQVRLFLRQADEAWRKLDVEGAKNLATKAKLLLDELQG